MKEHNRRKEDNVPAINFEYGCWFGVAAVITLLVAFIVPMLKLVQVILVMTSIGTATVSVFLLWPKLSRLLWRITNE